MHNVDKLERQQIGLRLPKYLVEDIDALTKEHTINRTDIIIEAVRSYIEQQKEEKFYNGFEASCKELKEVLTTKKSNTLQTLDTLIDELDNHNA